ncbi:hypothetical protein J3458_001564 [Metarhizium acridum]|uniref:uncharacterized protein n=1 Tax=Metarhizium acridum TaxID=92637 RepID=UPI001C6AAFD3|nr:hypothetical protein J3458_001564 [Metarhizium acridum]
MGLSRLWKIVLGLAALGFNHTLGEKKLIIDTELFGDADDIGALLLALTHPHVDLLGVNVDYLSTYSGLAASSLLGYCGHFPVLIGLKRPFLGLND